MLSLQEAPSATSSAPSRVSSLGRDTDGPSASRVTAALPSSIKIGVFGPTGDEPLAVQAARERPATRKEKKQAARRTVSAAVDLKAELRAELEKAAAKGPPQRLRQQGAARRSSEVQAARSELVPPKPIFSPPETASSVASAVKGLLGEAGPGRNEESVGLSGVSKGFEDATAAAHASLERLDLSGVSEKMRDVAGQVKRLTQRRSVGSLIFERG